MRLAFRAKILSAALIVSFFASVLYPVVSTVSAKSSSDMNTSELAQSYSYLSGLSWCMANVNGPDGAGYFIGGDKAASGEWFTSTGDGEAVVGYIDGNTGDDGNKLKCNEIVSKAVALWEYDSALELLCTFYNKDNGSQRRDGTGCTEGDGDQTNDFSQLMTNSSKNISYFKKEVIDKIYGGTSPSDTTPDFGASQYELYLAAFTSAKGCRAVQGLSSGDDKYNYRDVTVAVSGTKYYYKSGTYAGQEVTDPNIIAHASSSLTAVTGPVDKTFDFHGTDSTDEANKIGVLTTLSGNVLGKTCKEIATQVSSLVEDYIRFYTRYPDKFSESLAQKSICITEPSADGCTVEPTTTSCSIDGIGWIVCPIMNFLAEVSDASFTFLANHFLETNVGIVEADDTNGVYVGWKMMRNIANVLFIIAFLIIVFSQMTGAGISNYGVKKMLPRLVVAAILVNISFFLCQILVDLSNILGFTIKGVFESIGASAGIPKEGATDGDVGTTFTSLVATVLALGAGATLLYVYLGALAPLLLAAVVALVMILFILLARQALIVLLIVLAPVAFVAFLLPNTQKWFDSWRKMFVALLLLFPIIALVYGAADLASNILGSTFQADDGSPNDSTWGQIMAAAILILPLFIVPVLLKKSLDGVYGLGAKINGIGAKVQGGARKKGTEMYNNSAVGRGRAVRKNAKHEFKNRRYAERLTDDGASGALTRAVAGGAANLGLTRGQRAQRDAVAANAKATVANAEAKEIADAQKVLVDQLGTQRAIHGENFDQDKYLEEMAKGEGEHAGATDIQRTAAMYQMTALGRDASVRKLQEHFRTEGNTHAQENLQRAIQASAGPLILKSPDIVKGRTAAFGAATGDQMATFSSGTATTHMQHIEQLHAQASAPATTPEEIAAKADAQKQLDKAIAVFNSSVEDITKNEALQAKFGADSGIAYQTAFAALPPALQSQLTGIAAIQSDGKIR